MHFLCMGTDPNLVYLSRPRSVFSEPHMDDRSSESSVGDPAPQEEEIDLNMDSSASEEEQADPVPAVPAPPTSAPTRQTRARGWCFTYNNYGPADESALRLLGASNDVRYLVFGREVAPTTGTPHLQGYVYYTNPRGFSRAKSDLPSGSHIEVTKGSAQQNYDYCSKGKDFEQFGDRPKSHGEGGRDAARKQYELALAAAKEGRPDDIPAVLYLRHFSAFETLLSRSAFLEKPVRPEITLRQWQHSLYDTLRSDPSPRKILMGVDPDGGVGKSTFSRWLCNELDVQLLAPAKGADLAFAIKPSRVYIIDVPRAAVEYVPWAMIEQIKNGCVFSSKYQSGMKCFAIPHVVLFLNDHPPAGVFSADRISLFDFAE